jgi:hypothetical protein
VASHILGETDGVICECFIVRTRSESKVFEMEDKREFLFLEEIWRRDSPGRMFVRIRELCMFVCFYCLGGSV